MFDRTFYRFSEVVERAGGDNDAVLEAVLQREVGVFLKFAHQDALAAFPDEPDDKENPARMRDPHSTWVRATVDGQWDGYEYTPTSGFQLSGWFRVEPDAAKVAALGAGFSAPLLVSAPCAARDYFPWEPWFRVLWPGQLTLADAWFAAAEVEKCLTGVPERGSRWPWGEYETGLLRDLDATVRRYWAKYDPSEPTTANTKETIVSWLTNERNLTRNQAHAIDLILRPKDIKPGPRK